MPSPPHAAQETLKVVTAIALAAVSPTRVGHGLAAVVTSSLAAGSQNNLLTPGREATVHGLS